MTDLSSSLRRSFLVRLVVARPRLFICALVGALADGFIPSSIPLHGITRLIISWNVGACLYLILAARMMFWSTHDRMRTRALQQDDGRIVILALVVAAAVSSVCASVAVLAVVKDMQGVVRYAHIGLTILTLLSSWAFTQVMFALHYAHDYSQPSPEGISAALSSLVSTRPITVIFFTLRASSGPPAKQPMLASAVGQCGEPDWSTAFSPFCSTRRSWR